MKKEEAFRERCLSRGLGAEATEAGVERLRRFEAGLGGAGLDDSSLGMVEAGIARLVAKGVLSEEGLLDLARYYVVAGADDIAIRLLAYSLPIGVLPVLAERLASIEGDEARERVMRGVSVPPPGSPPEAYPQAAGAFARALEKELGPERARRILTCNVHAIPASAFAAERAAFLEAPSAEAWAKGYHERQVAVLERHASDGSLWFEQRITRRVVDFVRESPEILGGVREGDFLMVTKIPYDPDGYLGARDPLERRRLACHCPLASSSITEGGAEVPASWCACSAGYEKALFDAVFGEEVEVRATETVLGGSERCRFSVLIPSSAR